MNRSRSVLLLAVAAAFVGAVALLPACSVKDPPALTVGDYTLSRTAFLDEMNTLTNKGVFKDQSSAATPTSAGGTTTIPSNYKTSDTARVLNVHAQKQILEQDLARRHITVTDADKQAFLQNTAAQAAQQGQQVTADQLAQQLEGLDDLTKTNVNNRIAQQALARALVSDDEALQRAKSDYDTNKDKLAKICLSYIHATAGTAPTQANPSPPAATDADYAAAQTKLDAAKAKIQAGSSFADVAKTDSDDPQTAPTGGALPQCLTAENLQQLPPEVVKVATDQPVNAVSDAVKIEGDGLYLFQVTSRATPAFPEVQDQLIANAKAELAQDRVSQAVADAARQANVVVDPLFGEWDATKFQVVAPTGAAEPSTSTTATDGGLLGGLSPSAGGSSSGAGASSRAGSSSGGASPSSTAAP